MPSPLSKPLAPSWVNRFKEQSLERGRRYALENRVRIVEAGDSTITASCEGSGGNVYRQTIRLKESAKGTLILLEAACTCPVRINCKHCAAVLLQVQETLAYPAAEKDALLLEKLQAVLENRSPKAPPQVLVDNVQPVPRLWLASIEFSAFEPRNGKMQRYIQHRAALSFSYLDEYVSGQRNTDVLIRQDAQTLRIKRQTEVEQSYREQLRILGFKIATRQSKALPESAGELYEMVNDSAWLTLTLNDLPKLRNQGWELQIDEDFGFDLTAVDEWYATVEETPERDWFDLELGIIVNGERLSLLPILLNLMRSHIELFNPERLARRRDDELILVNLPNRPNSEFGPQQVALPYGRLKPVLATLGEFYLQEPGTTKLRLNSADALRLNPLQDMPLSWEGGEHIRGLAQRLRDIKDYTSTAPEGLNATLRPYQLEGLSWMQSLRQLEVGGILADDMGLGKTLQTLAHILSEKNAGRLDRPCMVVMPTSLIPNWLDEAAHFTPQLKVLALYGAGRKKHFDRLADYDLVLTTYALLPKDVERLAAQPLHVLILDEAQYIKNPNSKAAQAARELNARQRLCLSGTPLENHLGELWSLFHFLLPGWLGDVKSFNRDYRVPIEKRGSDVRLQHLNGRIKPFLLRRTKEQVATELPPKTEIIHWVELSDAQRDVYETMRLAMDKKVRDEITRKGVARSQIIILEALLKLRQVCCDLRLLNDAALPARGSTSGKLDSLMEMLEELFEEGRRVLLFSQFTSMLSLIEDELKKRGVEYAILTGQTRDRRTPVKEFQSGKRQIFLISLKAGGVGLNLTEADTVIHYDPWWNPATENQATDRAYRIGQEKPVFVYKLIARGTVEEKIQLLQKEKSDLAAGVLDGRVAGDWKLQSDDIEALFAPLPDKLEKR
ncbi:DEAD/DEAH box helicase [Pseudomonas fluorescens]|uniref:SWIM zinc finger family protein n=1 Tax=Pseudomonas fluorescens TaxID=294 RepID=A0A944HCZ6_PSEFL|nr:DEAD/DEAH box helicase [Pseudomonas fluorescens]MBT2294592.1 SWIM zinc finger family protein [Pseudomonas fluorescens]MBT2306752.1 SWIM zinc finger family protein [Pseudomonas fluorescens]MBT2316338.1 SWIM zinc finger family protein [Pseudomonas fluorescens]MBT2330130.1 SWIM zinc finger family protein [Pseudomonas fluorescens]MBT2342843.1 SWIM zinc finger family protein [Pseudomonas fluorescens]